MEASGHRAELGGRPERVHRSVLDRALQEVDVPVPSVPRIGEVGGDRDERGDTVGVVPAGVAEGGRHLVEPGGDEVGRQHHRSFVAGHRVHQPFHDGRVTDDDRVVRLIHLDRSLTAPPADRAQPSEGESVPVITLRGPGEQLLHDAVPDACAAQALTLLDDGGHEQLSRDLQHEQPSTAVEIERVQQRGRAERLLPVRLTADRQQLRGIAGRHPGAELG